MGLLERLFGQQESRQPTVPQEIEGFVNQLQQGVDGQLLVKRQQEVERENAEKARIADEEAKKASVIARQKEIEDQVRARIVVASAEASRVLQSFQIPEKLKYIQETSWAKRGEIRIVDPVLDLPPSYPRRRLGGLELVYFYPDCLSVVESGMAGCDISAHWVSWLQHYRGNAGTHLSIMLFEYLGKEDQVISSLEVRSGIMNLRKNPEIYDAYRSILKKYVSMDQADCGDLDKALIEDVAKRSSDGFLPAQLEKEASERLSRARRSREWKSVKESAGPCPDTF